VLAQGLVWSAVILRRFCFSVWFRLHLAQSVLFLPKNKKTKAAKDRRTPN
jgi:hypothetical protein